MTILSVPRTSLLSHETTAAWTSSWSRIRLRGYGCSGTLPAVWRYCVCVHCQWPCLCRVLRVSVCHRNTTEHRMCVCVCCQAATKDFCGHSAAVEGVVFTPDDSLLLSVGGEDTTLCQWRVVWRDVAAVARPGAGTEAATRAALAKAHQQWVRGARWLGHPACMLWW